ncbi:MAG: FAD-dependent oxidoreductase [Candidatus Uhrbacteria bacterium]
MEHLKRVIVVGGGLAGLSAAYRLLLGKNVEVDLFESEPLLGGRVQCRPVRGQPVDFGGFLIYPWYEETHRLLGDMGLEDRLAKTPLSDIYYFLDRSGIATKEEDVPFSVADGLKIWGKSFFQLLPKPNLAAPDLDRFGGMTVSAYLRSTLGTDGHAGPYETFFDTVNQGYCYGPVTETKAAFMAPIVRQVKVHGDIRTTSFFPDGIAVLVDALAKEIVALGGRIHVSSPVVAVDGQTIRTDAGTFASDAIVFAQTVSDDLYREILPDVIPDCWYTHFVTAAVELDTTPIIANTREWGAAFYAPNESASQETLSAINLASLYGPSLAECVMVNVIIRGRDRALSDDETNEIIRSEIARIFPGRTLVKIVDTVHWTKTMPVSQEAFVKSVRDAQGTNGHYFAGDFLGAPSIETAIATGTAAAAAVLAS